MAAEILTLGAIQLGPMVAPVAVVHIIVALLELEHQDKVIMARRILQLLAIQVAAEAVPVQQQLTKMVVMELH